MSGFSNPIVDHIGDLEVNSVHSPNFVTGVSGWTIRKDGSAEFNNGVFRGSITGATFRAKNSFGATIMTINVSSGSWILYNDTGSVTQGVPVAWGAASDFTDEFGNSIKHGIMAANTGQNAFALLQDGALNLAPTLTGMFSPFPLSGILASAAGIQTMQSGGTAAGDTAGQFTLNSQNAGGTIFPYLQLTANTQLVIPAGQGPFILGETFHGLSNPAGFTGTMRVKKLPWNAIWYDLEGSTNAAGTFTFGAPPDNTYNPTTARHFDVGGANVNSRLFIPSGSGGPQVITAAANAVGGSWMVPTN